MGSKTDRAKMRKKSNSFLINPVFNNKFLSRKSNLFSITFFIALMKSGIWVFPAIYASFVISQQPFQQPFSNPDDQYLMTTWFASYLANILGIKTLASFIILHFIFALYSIYLLFRFIRRNVEITEQGKSLLLFAMLPAASTIFYWVGMDSFTFLIMVTYLNVRKYLLAVLLLGVIGGLHHFEILFVSSVSLLIYQFLRILPKVRSQELFSACSFMFGILIGKLLLNFIFKVQGVVVSKNRVSIGFDGLKSNLELITKYGFLIYWSMLGVIWFILIMALVKRNRDSLALLLSLLIPLVVVFFVRDSSRVIQLTSFLTIAIGLISNKNILESISNKQIKIIFVFWLLIPWVWVWQGVFGSNILFSIKYVLSRLFVNDLAPWVGNITMWPFS
jgi:hypothetical protein